MYLALNLRKRLLLLLCFFVVGFFVVNVLGVMVGVDTTPKVRIITVLQDLLMFIMPAVVTAVVVTRTPATLLAIDAKPTWRMLLLAVVCLVVSIPAMEVIVSANEKLPLPDDLARVMRQMEDGAAASLTLLCGKHDIPNLIMNILIVGVLAGLSEELLFRGGLQRLMVTAGVNAHTAIWITAVAFSALHMQFYGFVPRMLLGAFFGYMLYFSGSLWLPVILHILNNTVYLVNEYATGQPEMMFEGAAMYLAVAVSVVAVALCFVYLRKWRVGTYIDS